MLGIMYIQLQSYVIGKQSGTCRRYLLLHELCVPNFKITTYECKTTKHTRLYPASRYCTRIQGVKERIA